VKQILWKVQRYRFYSQVRLEGSLKIPLVGMVRAQVRRISASAAWSSPVILLKVVGGEMLLLTEESSSVRAEEEFLRQTDAYYKELLDQELRFCVLAEPPPSGGCVSH
jgi:hypothetical protein